MAPMKNNAVSSSDPEFSQLEALQDQVLADVERFRGADRLGRDELHLRDHQDHPGVTVNPFQSAR